MLLGRQVYELRETPYRKRFASRFSVPRFRFMEADKENFAGPLEARLYRTVEKWCTRRQLGLRAFGAAATGDAEFVPDLAQGRSPTLETVDAVLASMNMTPVGPFFDAEVDAFLAVTGTKRSVLGREATNNPSFVAHLEDSMSPTLRTVGKVRSWMTAQASPAEARAIRRQAGPHTEFLSDTPRRRPRLSSEAPAAPLLANVDEGQEPDDWDDLPFIDTEEAAALVGLAPATLQRYRSTGGGPVFYRFPERLVRYRHEDLAMWEAARRR